MDYDASDLTRALPLRALDVGALLAETGNARLFSDRLADGRVFVPWLNFPTRARATGLPGGIGWLPQREVQDHRECGEHEEPDRRAARLALRVHVEQRE